MSKSDIKYLHKTSYTHVEDGKVEVIDEQIIHGSKGLSFKMYKKADGKVEKYTCFGNADGTYTLKHRKDDKEDTQTLTKEELLKELKSVKALAFAVDYIKSAKDLKGGKRGSRKTSRKTSKKSSRKSSRKTSRKSSRK